MQYPFRDRFSYTNFMYMVLGHVAEKMGGDTWENLVTSRLFKPIGMTRSSVIRKTTDVMAKGVARPYIYKDGKLHNGHLDIYEYTNE